MFMLMGEFNHQLDAKNRIRIPAKLRKEIGEEYYFAYGATGCIAVYPKCTIEDIKDKISADMKLSDIDKLESVRRFTRKMSSVEEDSEGRVVISPAFKKFAKIDKNVVTIGVVDHAEIWAKEVYDEHFGADDENEVEAFDDMLRKLGI